MSKKKIDIFREEVYEKVITPMSKRVFKRKKSAYDDFSKWKLDNSVSFDFIRFSLQPLLNILEDPKEKKNLDRFLSQFEKNFSPKFSFYGDDHLCAYTCLAHRTNRGDIKIRYISNWSFKWNPHGIDRLFYREYAIADDCVGIESQKQGVALYLGNWRALLESGRLHSREENLLEKN